MVDDMFRGHSLEVELQAAGQHGYRQLLGIRRGQQELDVLRGLFQGFQEGVEGLIGEHVYLVNQVHLETAPGRRILDVVGQLPHIVHPGTGGGVNLNQVNKPAVQDFLATGALTAGVGRNAGFTVQTAGQQSADRGLAHAPGAGEKVSMMKPVMFKRVHQRLQHMLLPHHVLEASRAPFTGEYLITHRSSLHG